MSINERENLALAGGRRYPTRNGPLDWFFMAVVTAGVFVLVLWALNSWSNLHGTPTPTPIQTSESVNEDVPRCTDAIADAGGICIGEPLPPCATEDSDNCYWDAATRGRAGGESFITEYGITTYSDGTVVIWDDESPTTTKEN